MNNPFIISDSASIKEALAQLNETLGRTLFITNSTNKVLCSISDGDIRRALLKGHTITDLAVTIGNTSFKYIEKGTNHKAQFQDFKNQDITLVPLLDSNKQLIDIIDISQVKTILPLDAVIMAGGKGTRLLPLTENTPKPLLKVGDKPIIEYNTDRLASFGINNVSITVNYLSEQIISYFEANNVHQLNFNFIKEDRPLGTIGALKLIEDFKNDYILLMNSDLLTNIDFEDVFNNFLSKQGDALVATVPYKVNIPYGVVETKDDYVVDLKEKPSYTYYSNAGIYIFKKECLDFVPEDAFFNATDLIEALIKEDKKVINYPILGYWLDIGKHDDFEKAQNDVKHIIL